MVCLWHAGVVRTSCLTAVLCSEEPAAEPRVCSLVLSPEAMCAGCKGRRSGRVRAWRLHCLCARTPASAPGHSDCSGSAGALVGTDSWGRLSSRLLVRGLRGNGPWSCGHICLRRQPCEATTYVKSCPECLRPGLPSTPPPSTADLLQGSGHLPEASGYDLSQ